MTKKARKAAAAAVATALVLPLVACGTAAVGTDGAQPVYDGTVSAVIADSVPNAAELGERPETPVTNVSEPTAALDTPVTVADEDIASTDKTSEKHEGAYLWDGDLAKVGWSGTSSVSAPSTYVKTADTVVIHDATAFAYFAHEASLIENNGFKGYTVRLECDIDLNNELWIPVSFISRKRALVKDGSGRSVAFKGVFDGNGHTVYGLSAEKFNAAIKGTVNGKAVDAYLDIGAGKKVSLLLDEGTEEVVGIGKNAFIGEFVYGIFGSAGNAVIRDFTVADVNIDLEIVEVPNTATSGAPFYVINDSVGAVVGYSGGNLELVNVTAGSAEDHGHIGYSKCVGGIVGRAYGPVRHTADGTTEPVGGMAASVQTNKYYSVAPNGGDLGSLTFTNCTNYIDLQDDVTDKDQAKKGGVIGHFYSFKTIEFDGCANYGDIGGNLIAAGGMFSYSERATVYGYLDDGLVTPFDFSLTLKNCVNYGSIRNVLTNKTTNNAQIGGLIGWFKDQVFVTPSDTVKYTKTFVIEDCKNYGAVYNDSTTSGTGGIIGEAWINRNTSFDLKRCYNYADITAVGNIAGGIIGRLKIDNCVAQDVVLSGGNCGNLYSGSASVSGGCVGALASGNYTAGYLLNAGTAYKIGE